MERSYSPRGVCCWRSFSTFGPRVAEGGGKFIAVRRYEPRYAPLLTCSVWPVRMPCARPAQEAHHGGDIFRLAALAHVMAAKLGLVGFTRGAGT